MEPEIVCEEISKNKRIYDLNEHTGLYVEVSLFEAVYF